jgi:hypothetical protein
MRSLVRMAMLIACLTGSARAGSLDSPAPPTSADSAMYTLDDIYNRLNAGTAGAKRVGGVVMPAVGAVPTMATTDEIMAVAPAVDEVNGAAVADVAEGKTFWGLTSGEWGIQVGTSVGGGGQTSPAPVAKTGQTIKFADGDDGDLQKGVGWPVPRLTDNLNGTVTDNLTGLIWLKKDCAFGGQMYWQTALTNCEALKSGMEGLTDGSKKGNWRLPNIRELMSLVDYKRFTYYALPDGPPYPIGICNSGVYWSSTTDADDRLNAWCGIFAMGYMRSNKKVPPYGGSGYWVLPVRGGQ